jgi:hypothetical protein
LEYDAKDPGQVGCRVIVVVSKLCILAVAGIAGCGGLCSPLARSEALPEHSPTPSEKRAGELGLNVFGLSLHTNRNADFNELNPGIGLRYTFWDPAPRWTVFGDSGIFYDSRRNWAKYVAVGTSYRFAESWYAGLGVGYAQSRTYNQGTPFFAVIPGIGFEYRRVTFNAVLLPDESSTSKVAGLAFFLTVPLANLQPNR